MVVVFPPATELGESTTPESTGGFKVRSAFAELPLAEADMAIVFVEATEVVVTVNLADVAPCATVMDAGTEAEGSPLDTDTASPPDGAGALSVTVAVVLWLPVNVDRVSPSEETPTSSWMFAVTDWLAETITGPALPVPAPLAVADTL